MNNESNDAEQFTENYPWRVPGIYQAGRLCRYYHGFNNQRMVISDSAYEPCYNVQLTFCYLFFVIRGVH
ncbi:hypothetical protein BADSM9389_16530 [Buttiauxella agrestis]|nr:hypothetical protein BADSM9389_16530 [Buttiauxella agrestis]